MSTSPSQPLRIGAPEPNKDDILRELDAVHKVINDRLISSDQADLSEAYTAADLGTAAEIATALNTTNTLVNILLGKVRLKP